jgi:hypothetical protein
MSTHETDDLKVTYEDSPEAHKAAYDMLLKWFIKNDMFCGDSIGQSDTTYIEAPELLAELAEDVFKFDTEWKE